MPPKAFVVLRCLLDRPGQLVSKRELMEAVWPGTFVAEVALNVAIRQLREAFADNPKAPRFIETIHRRGFRWIGGKQEPVAQEAEVPSTTDFVGRATNLADLERSYARAAAGTRQMVFVTGDPGIGKTALIERFLMGLGTSGARVAPSKREAAKTLPLCLIARGQCTESFIAGGAYGPMVEAMESLLRGGGKGMRSVFTRCAPTWMLQMPDLSTSEELEELRRAVTASNGARMQRELERAIEAASRERTIVLVLEDLHWSDPATVGLLWALAGRREAARLLIIGTYRPVDAISTQHPLVRMKQELASKKQCAEIALDGLDAKAIDLYLDRRFVDHALPAELAQRLQIQTSGNPLFLLNALADFEERGWLSESEGAWRCRVDLATLAAAIPDSTRELISFRLDQLSDATRELLEAASAAGEVFPTQVLAAAVARNGDEVENECALLERAGLFLQADGDVEWPDGSRGRRHTFCHALYRQVLDARVTPTRRQLLHRRIAARLEEGYGARSSEIAGQLCFHCEQAGDLLRALEHLEVLVPQAYARCATHEAETLAAHALALVKRLLPSEQNRHRLLQATIGYGLALGASRGMGDAEVGRVFNDARALGQSIPTTAEHAMSLVSLAVGALLNGQLHEMRRIGEELLALAGPDAPPITAISANLIVGIARLHLGDIGASRVYDKFVR